MLEQTLAFARIKDEEKTVISVALPISTKETLDEIAHSEKISLTTLVSSALRVVCEEWNLDTGLDIITKERASLYKLLAKEEDKLEPYLAHNEDYNGFEHRGYFFNQSIQDLGQQKMDLIIDKIERYQKELKIEKGE